MVVEMLANTDCLEASTLVGDHEVNTLPQALNQGTGGCGRVAGRRRQQLPSAMLLPHALEDPKHAHHAGGGAAASGGRVGEAWIQRQLIWIWLATGLTGRASSSNHS
jgi:hypothetical protein